MFASLNRVQEPGATADDVLKTGNVPSVPGFSRMFGLPFPAYLRPIEPIHGLETCCRSVCSARENRRWPTQAWCWLEWASTAAVTKLFGRVPGCPSRTDLNQSRTIVQAFFPV